MSQAPEAPMGMTAGVLSSLFDMEFKSLITVRVIKLLYWLIVILASLSALLTLLRVLFTGRPVAMILAVILTPLVYLLEITLARVALEFVLVTFRIADDVQAIRGRAPAAATYPEGGGGAAHAQDPQYPQYPSSTEYQYPGSPQYPQYPQDPGSPQYPQYPQDPGSPQYPQDPGHGPDPGNAEPGQTTTGDDEPWIT